jgi:hypothetical protein
MKVHARYWETSLVSGSKTIFTPKTVGLIAFAIAGLDAEQFGDGTYLFQFHDGLLSARVEKPTASNLQLGDKKQIMSWER